MWQSTSDLDGSKQKHTAILLVSSGSFPWTNPFPIYDIYDITFARNICDGNGGACIY